MLSTACSSTISDVRVVLLTRGLRTGSGSCAANDILLRLRGGGGALAVNCLFSCATFVSFLNHVIFRTLGNLRLLHLLYFAKQSSSIWIIFSQKLKMTNPDMKIGSGPQAAK